MSRAVNRIFKIVLLVIGVVLLGLHMMLGPLFYYAPSFSARVIDEETSQPVEGAAVLAAWRVDGGLLHPDSKILHVEEALTNEEGVFTIDGWWPRPRPPFYRIEKGGPVLMLYKPGFRTVREYNPRTASSWRLKSFWEGKAIPMERDGNDPEDYGESWDWADFFLKSVERHKGPRCCPLFSRTLEMGAQ